MALLLHLFEFPFLSNSAILQGLLFDAYCQNQPFYKARRLVLLFELWTSKSLGLIGLVLVCVTRSSSQLMSNDQTESWTLLLIRNIHFSTLFFSVATIL